MRPDIHVTVIEEMAMTILKLFSGPSPEKLEQKGDALFEAGQWGSAKLQYERALHKLEKNPGQEVDRRRQLSDKILQAREALAREHQQSAGGFIEGGYLEDAREMLTLAMEITADPGFRQELETQIHEINAQQKQRAIDALPDHLPALEEDNAEEEPPSEALDEEYFIALCNTLPDEVREAYLDYGENFKAGYIALNRGSFQTAAQLLAREIEENPHPDSYVPLELATAYLNLGEAALAQELLENFLRHHPEALPAYQLLCEIYWDQKDFKRVDTLLSSLPDEFANSLAVVLLKGETLYRSGEFETARGFYRTFLDTYGWNEAAARELAKIHEALDDLTGARVLYKEIMGRCSGCRARIEPEIKHKYAELCFAEGLHETEILELYLSLAREIPENAAEYFDRISRIYTTLGNATEADRFQAFSERARSERGQT